MTGRSRLPFNVLANVGNAGAGIGVALITTPLILDQVGTAGYGVWTIALSFVLYLAIAEQGFGPATQRFIAVSQGAGDLRAGARIMWTTLAGYVLIGVVAMGATVALAGPIVGLFDIPEGLHDDAVQLFRLVGFTLPVALIATALGNVQAGLERFPSIAAATIAGSLVYLALLILLVALDANLFQLGFAVLGQQVAMLLVRLVTLWDVVRSGRPALVTRTETGELLRFSAKLQVSVLAALVNGQSDRVVVGLVAPASTVGQFGIAAQFTEAGRLVGAAAITPTISRLSATHGAGDPGRLHREFQTLNRLWLLAIVGATLIGLGAVYPILTGWLGSGHGEAIEFAMVLVVANGIGMLTGTRLAYLRAINQIGLEAWVGAITIGLNVALTVPLALLIGPFGVVAGTLGAYAAGTAIFVYRFNRFAPPVPGTPLGTVIRASAIALLAAALALGWGALMVWLVPSPFALVPVLVGVAAAFVGYLSAMTGIRPSPALVRQFFR